MTKIVINLLMNEKYDIVMTNSLTNTTKTIEFSTKNINAYDIYELFDYKNDYNYTVESNINDIDDGNEKDYFKEVISLINDIKKEINDINDIPANDSEIEEDESAFGEELVEANNDVNNDDLPF